MDEEHARAHRETQRAWNDNAAFWDQRMGEGNDFVEVLTWPATLRLLAPRKTERILDVACGNGLTSRRLAALGVEVVAVDFAEAMLNRARTRTTAGAGLITYLLVDATDEESLVALGERSFDGLLCSMALFDMADVTPLMRAGARLLKPGGRFVFSVLHPCFNNTHVVQAAELEDDDGTLVTTYSVKVRSYKTPSVARGVAIAGQPAQHFYFDRPLEVLFGAAFAAGFALDGLEEPSFPPDNPAGRNPLGWSGNFSEIPPVLVARLRLLPSGSPS